MAEEMKIEDLQKQADEYLNGWKRAKADFVNLQNEMARERTEWVQFATARCLERLLPVADTLHAALDHEPKLIDIVRKLEDFLSGEGLEEIEASGTYDPGVHEVVGREKNESTEAGTIVSVAQRGYRLHGKVLRPTKVIIAE